VRTRSRRKILLSAQRLVFALLGLAAIDACGQHGGPGADLVTTDAPPSPPRQTNDNAVLPSDVVGDAGDASVGDAPGDAPPACHASVPPSGDGGNALIHVSVTGDAGGAVSARRNGGFVGQTIDRMDVVYMKGDEFSFTALPCVGHPFVKFCADPPACTLTTMANPYTGAVTADAGSVAAQFN
jgi:hypothetical protein